VFRYPTHYDVIVVGSGHAGIEAALASARLGCQTLMLTQNLDTIGQMSCNPAIGGSAKGQIVREIDALGGAMGINADATAIQLRLLNRSKGAAVQAPRAQCDKKAYQFRMKGLLERTPCLHLKQATVSKVIVAEHTAIAVETDVDVTMGASSIVITAGTFLRGLLHIGNARKPGGRMADAHSALSENLKHIGFEVRRFKTGTPCRLNGCSIDFDRCQVQLGDEPPPRFSFWDGREAARNENVPSLGYVESRQFHVEQLPCWITQTNARTHRIIGDNLDRSPLYAGRIEGTGPRYCPSIEDKIVKFPDRSAHQLFLEPEGRYTEEYYVNGISTSLPYDVQLELVHSVQGLERAEIMRPGYAVEYDYFPPTQLSHTLETKLVRGLFFAGQVNGTSGYEEAAAQGLIAGCNAALSVQRRTPFIVKRSEGYIGVLIDDLVTKGIDEPYRMFSSRAEDRLRLRHDNADQRLAPHAFALGLIGKSKWAQFQEKLTLLDHCRALANQARIGGVPLNYLLKRPDFEIARLPTPTRAAVPDEIWELLTTEIRYEGYLRRQTQQNKELERNSHQAIPDGFDFERVPGLSFEARQKLVKIRPASIRAAGLISGVTPADVSILHISLRCSHLCGNREA
jgi:tRNA uridine 5-carboxymethylaminomethyl modification enzyme